MFPGIDVSGNNPPEVITPDLNFVLIKLTEGNAFVDSYGSHVRRCRDLALPCIGGYHFARPDLHSSPAAELDNFLREYESAGLDCAALDIEVGNGSPEWADKFCSGVKDRLGIIPYIYTSPEYADNNNFGRLESLQQYPLWLAHWGVQTPTVPAPWSNWAIWQYGGDGVDRNVSRRGMEFHRMATLDEDDRKFITSEIDRAAGAITGNLSPKIFDSNVKLDNVKVVLDDTNGKVNKLIPSPPVQDITLIPIDVLLSELRRRTR